MDYRDYPILYVDDESANRVVIKHNLGSVFSLLLADSGATALEILRHEPVAVLLTDQRMPGMSGVDLAEQTLERHPDVVRVIITAYSDLEATIDAINRAQVNRFIKKPWTREELVAVMKDSVLACHRARLLEGMQQRLLHLDRVTSVAVMSGAIAHDLQQPLTYIEPTVQVLLHQAGSLRGMRLAPAVAVVADEIIDGLQDVDEGVKRFKLIAKTLLESLRGNEISRGPIDLRQVVESAALLTRSTVMAVAELDVNMPPEPVVALAAEGPMMQLLVNLLLNAAQAMASDKTPGSRVAVSLGVEDGRVVLAVEDNGCGMSTECQKKIFAPFYTTKGAAGTGLGLAICKQILNGLDGTIAVDSTPGRGSRFVVSLPPGSARPSSSAPVAGEDAGGR